MKHLAIVGDRGVGKSTLIQRVLSGCNVPMCGFETKKEDSLADPLLGSPVYIYEAGKDHIRTSDNLLGYTGAHDLAASAKVFNRFSDTLKATLRTDGIVVLDELGFMEAHAEKFCQTIYELLDADAPVLMAVKSQDIPFLNAVRNHPHVMCLHITEENRDDLYEEALEYMKRALRSS